MPEQHVPTGLPTTAGRAERVRLQDAAHQVLIDDVVLFDNLRAHKDRKALSFIYAAGATVKFMPPYSPEFNPIELVWSKPKGLLRTAKARTLDELNEPIGWAMELITPNDARGWFKHCGFQIQAA